MVPCEARAAVLCFMLALATLYLSAATSEAEIGDEVCFPSLLQYKVETQLDLAREENAASQEYPTLYDLAAEVNDLATNCTVQAAKAAAAAHAAARAALAGNGAAKASHGPSKRTRVTTADEDEFDSASDLVQKVQSLSLQVAQAATWAQDARASTARAPVGPERVGSAAAAAAAAAQAANLTEQVLEDASEVIPVAERISAQNLVESAQAAKQAALESNRSAAGSAAEAAALAAATAASVTKARRGGTTGAPEADQGATTTSEILADWQVALCPKGFNVPWCPDYNASIPWGLLEISRLVQKPTSAAKLAAAQAAQAAAAAANSSAALNATAASALAGLVSKNRTEVYLALQTAKHSYDTCRQSAAEAYKAAHSTTGKVQKPSQKKSSPTPCPPCPETSQTETTTSLLSEAVPLVKKTATQAFVSRALANDVIIDSHSALKVAYTTATVAERNGDRESAEALRVAADALNLTAYEAEQVTVYAKEAVQTGKDALQSSLAAQLAEQEMEISPSTSTPPRKAEAEVLAATQKLATASAAVRAADLALRQVQKEALVGASESQEGASITSLPDTAEVSKAKAELSAALEAEAKVRVSLEKAKEALPSELKTREAEKAAKTAKEAAQAAEAAASAKAVAAAKALTDAQQAVQEALTAAVQAEAHEDPEVIAAAAKELKAAEEAQVAAERQAIQTQRELEAAVKIVGELQTTFPTTTTTTKRTRTTTHRHLLRRRSTSTTTSTTTTFTPYRPPRWPIIVAHATVKLTVDLVRHAEAATVVSHQAATLLRKAALASEEAHIALAIAEEHQDTQVIAAASKLVKAADLAMNEAGLQAISTQYVDDYAKEALLKAENAKEVYESSASEELCDGPVPEVKSPEQAMEAADAAVAAAEVALDDARRMADAEHEAYAAASRGDLQAAAAELRNAESSAFEGQEQAANIFHDLEAEDKADHEVVSYYTATDSKKLSLATAKHHTR